MAGRSLLDVVREELASRRMIPAPFAGAADEDRIGQKQNLAPRMTDADVEVGRQIYADCADAAELSWESAARPDAGGASVQEACRALGTARDARMRTLGCRRVLDAVAEASPAVRAEYAEQAQRLGGVRRSPEESFVCFSDLRAAMAGSGLAADWDAALIRATGRHGALALLEDLEQDLLASLRAAGIAEARHAEALQKFQAAAGGGAAQA